MFRDQPSSRADSITATLFPAAVPGRAPTGRSEGSGGRETRLMRPERFRQIRNLFEAALERDGDDRTVFLSEACRGDDLLRTEVAHLLAAHGEPGGSLGDGPLTDAPSTGTPGRLEGRRIDHYEILRELGRGGMGTVYLAVRTDDVYRKPVAIKVVRPDASREAVQRFRQEREIVASLDHPHIARLLDGGTTPEGRPYFVMDYVDGQPIDAYCDDRQLSVARAAQAVSVCMGGRRIRAPASRRPSGLETGQYPGDVGRRGETAGLWDRQAARHRTSRNQVHHSNRTAADDTGICQPGAGQR